MDAIIIRAKGGSAECKVNITDIDIPDLWHVAMRLKESGDIRGAEMVLETWYLAHDFKNISSIVVWDSDKDCATLRPDGNIAKTVAETIAKAKKEIAHA